MNFIDTHAHLYAEQFDQDRDEMINKAFNAGVEKILLPNINEASIPGMEALVNKYPGKIFSMMGIHPCDVQKDWQSQLARVKSNFVLDRHIAIGEIGVDLYWDKSLKQEQMDTFKAQIIWAKELNIPIVIHARDAFDEIFEVVDELNDENLNGIFHCFTGNEHQAKKIMNYGGFLMGIGGVVTFKNSGLDKVLKSVPLESLVLETDAPYLAPVPFRGKRNESAYIPHIAEKVADIYDVSLHEVAEITTQNAIEMFNLTTKK